MINHVSIPEINLGADIKPGCYLKAVDVSYEQAEPGHAQLKIGHFSCFNCVDCTLNNLEAVRLGVDTIGPIAVSSIQAFTKAAILDTIVAPPCGTPTDPAQAYPYPGPYAG